MKDGKLKVNEGSWNEIMFYRYTSDVIKSEVVYLFIGDFMVAAGPSLVSSRSRFDSGAGDAEM